MAKCTLFDLLRQRNDSVRANIDVRNDAERGRDELREKEKENKRTKPQLLLHSN